MTRKIIDGFIFYNELNLLKYRLNILYDVIDYFIIVESTHTFTGKEKELYFNNNKSEFDKFKDKIIHIIVDNFPYKYPNINYLNNEQWINEGFQRDSILKGVYKINDLIDNDLIIISDLDEIPDPRVLNIIKNQNINIEIYSLEMDFYYYNLRTIFENKWYYSKIISFKKFKEINLSFTDIRNLNLNEYIKQSGWHLSYFGDSNFIKNKIQTFSHQEYNTDIYTNILNISQKIEQCKDLFDREVHPKKVDIQNNNYLPIEYDKYLTNFF